MAHSHRIMFSPLMVMLSSCLFYQATTSVSPGLYPKVLIASSWGLPVELNCESTKNPRIQVSGITLVKQSTTVAANKQFPGIEAKAQKECDNTHRLPNASYPAGCQLAFSGLDVPGDVMVVVVFWCYSGSHSYKEDQTASSTSGDVDVTCGNGDIIEIKGITVNNEPPADYTALKNSCSDQMLANKLPSPGDLPGHEKPAVCKIERKGKIGEIKVKYRCESAPRRTMKELFPKEPARFPMALS